MPLLLPNLDDRRWNDLVEEGRGLIPRYAPDWNDHNVHDPGITLMELYAWLAEMSVYRLNRVPPRHRRKFLALLGFNSQPPQAAATILTFSPDAGMVSSVPAGTQFETASAAGLAVPVRTLRDLDVSAVATETVLIQPADDAVAGPIQDLARSWRNGVPIALFGSHPQPPATFYLGFSELPAEVPIALALHFQGPGNERDERRRIVNEEAAQQTACRPILPDVACEQDESSPPREPAETPPVHHSAHVVWEVCISGDASSWLRLDPVSETIRPGVGQIMDDTRSLTLDGIIEVNVPLTRTQTSLGGLTDPLFYLRCRLESGAYDAPPVLLHVALNAVRAEQAIPIHQTFAIAADIAPAGSPPTQPGETVRLYIELDDDGGIQALTFNPVTAAGPEVAVLHYQEPHPEPGQITLGMVLGGLGNGHPHQQVTLPGAPLQVDSLQLYTLSDQGWREWTRRQDLDASRRTDHHFVVNAMTGGVSFGDGERGRAPSIGALILASYRTTVAEEGNIPARARWQAVATPFNDGLPADLPFTVNNPIPARDGASAETLASATGRAVALLHAHERLLELCTEAKCRSLDQVDRQRVLALQPPARAVNLLDIERLALDVPGTRVARARAWAGMHPDYPCLEAPGVVTLVVVPDMPVPKPAPSPGLLTAIKRYLDCRRMVTTRLVVVAPQYLEVRVTTRVRKRSLADAGSVLARINAALNAFLDPRRGGPNELGWPFGRDVYRTEILQLIDGINGVDYVLELTLSSGDGEAQCGNLTLCPTWLVTPGEHQVEIV